MSVSDKVTDQIVDEAVARFATNTATHEDRIIILLARQCDRIGEILGLVHEMHTTWSHDRRRIFTAGGVVVVLLGVVAAAVRLLA